MSDQADLDIFDREVDRLIADEVERNDTANADILARLYSHRLRYVPLWNEWLVWAGHRWQRDPRAVQVSELAKDVGRALLTAASEIPDSTARGKALNWANQTLGAGRIKAMIELTRGIDSIALDHETLDTDPWLLGVANGVVDLRTGQHRPGDPADLMTMACPVEYDSNAEAPRWEKALVEWFPDPDVRAYFHRLVGESLVGSQRDHHLILHYGDGANGKGSAVRAIMRVLGPYATVIHKSLLVETRHEQHDTEKAKLFRARLAVAAETSKRVQLNEASVKNLTGGDRISARKMREDPWEFDPSHSLWLQTNYLPAINGRDPGIWRRLKVVPWVAHFSGHPDRDLDHELAAEAPGILRWCIDGALSYLADGLEEPDAVKRATLAYRSAEDVFGRFATDVGLVIGPDLSIPGALLVDTFNDWCKETGARPNIRDLATWITEQGAAKSRRRIDGKPNPVMVWDGVGITENEPSVHPVQGSPVSPRKNPIRETIRGTPAHPAHTDEKLPLSRDFPEPGESPPIADNPVCSVCDQPENVETIRGEPMHRRCRPAHWLDPEEITA